MKFILLLLFWILRSNQLTLRECETEARPPESSDISVQCGTSSIDIAIEICPVIFSDYNETLLSLNHMLEPVCRATLDESVNPPVARFSFPLNMTHACGSTFRTTGVPGTGMFSDYTVKISGVVRSRDRKTGAITYNAELKYYYSCSYPLQYVINNTQIDVASSSVLVEENKGSFLSTLSMELFDDASYTRPMVIPHLGIELNTNVYVEVKATNLTSQYHVLLDRCYASLSSLPSDSSIFNLFVVCSEDPFAMITENGDSQKARFKFPAFRFIEQNNLSSSAYYLHCITRLCVINTCSTFKECNSNRDGDTSRAGITKGYTITSPRIVTKAESKQSKENSVVGFGVAVGVLAFACIIAVIIAAMFCRRRRN
ncbi:zona pellucida-like domain-containing protein 1 [Pholidichthys leucotaenia]